MNTNQIITQVNLIKVNPNGTLNSVADWVTTNHRGWYELKSFKFTATSLEKLSAMVGRKLGRYMMITAK